MKLELKQNMVALILADEKQKKANLSLHPLINHTLCCIEAYEYEVMIHRDIIKWAKEDSENIVFSEDGCEFSQNWIGERTLWDEGYLDNAHNEVKIYTQKLEDKKILLRIFMDAFNGGWIF